MYRVVPFVALTSWVLVAAAFVLLWLTTRSGIEDNLFHYQDAAVGLAFPMLGWLVLRRAGSHPIGWLLMVAGLSGAVGAFAEEYVTVGLEVHPGSVPAVSTMAWIGTWMWAFFFALLPLLLLVFPDGRALSSRWRPVVWLAAVPVVLLPGGLAVATWSAPVDVLASSEQPPFSPVSEVVFLFSLALLIVALGAALVSVIIRWRQSQGLVRQQLKVFLLAVVVGVACLVVSQFENPLKEVAGVVGFLLVPIGIVAAILRYHLWDIDRIVSRTVTYGLLTALLVGGYAATVFVFRRLLPGQSDLAVAASTLLVAALFNPVRRRVQDRVDRRFNRERYDTELVVAAFGRELRSHGDLAHLEARLVEAAAATMEPEHASLWLGDDR